MKVISIIALFMAILAGSYALANPPSAINASYDSGRQELNIIAEHSVTDPREHFIKSVTIYKNGDEVVSKDFEYQTSHRNQTIPPMHVAAKPGDSLKIEAKCGRYGAGVRTLNVVGER